MSTDATGTGEISAPWLAFLREVDGMIEAPAEIHCIGAFALMVLTGYPRPTGDVDFIDVIPDSARSRLRQIASAGSDLAIKYGLHLHEVTIAEYPCDYGERLINLTPPTFRKLTVKVLEPHDLALTKLSRNSPKDRDDVRILVERCQLDSEILRKRFELELRPYLMTAAEQTILTLELWLEEFF
jgi:hypothetical protein